MHLFPSAVARLPRLLLLACYLEINRRGLLQELCCSRCAAPIVLYIHMYLIIFGHVAKFHKIPWKEESQRLDEQTIRDDPGSTRRTSKNTCYVGAPRTDPARTDPNFFEAKKKDDTSHNLCIGPIHIFPAIGVKTNQQHVALTNFSRRTQWCYRRLLVSIM